MIEKETMSLPRITAIIPTWNRAEPVARAIESVLAQTRPADEILVIDDGSTDDTAERIPALFPQIRFLRQENRGVSAARNLAIEAATAQEEGGTWLAFLDSDDTWEPQKLERQLEALAGRPERICHTDEIWIRNGRRVNPRQRHAKHGGRIYLECLPLCAMSPSSVMIHSDVFQEVGLFDEDLPACEDYDLWLRICAREEVLYVDEKLVVKYGGHEDQLSRTVEALDRYRIRALEKILVEDSLNESILSPEERAQTIEILLKKISVYGAGAERRGRTEEAEALRTLAERYRANQQCL